MTTQSMAIDVESLRDLLARRQPVTVVDVRPASERAEWSIPGSLHYDAYAALWDGDPDALSGLELPDDSPVVTVCAAGRTSLLAALQLRARGIPARSLTGGMKAWSMAWNHAELPLASSTATVIQVRRTGKGCLSYLIGSDSEAAVIDAALEPQVYIQLAREQGWTIRHVFDTHVHADHLSRSLLLAEETGATLHLPQQERVGYAFEPVRDGDVFEIGSAKLTALHTPGHTFESVSYLLDQQALFTGDTLFLESVGRPDLEANPDETRERARLLYRSLGRLTALDEHITVLPGHTSRPVAFDDETISGTLGEVRARIALLQLPEDEFIATILGRIPPTPPNHHLIVELNEAGFVLGRGDQTELEAGANRCAVA